MVFALSQATFADRPVRTGKAPAPVREGARPVPVIEGSGTVATALGVPSIVCAGVQTATSVDVTFCAGTHGAMAGYSVQWMTCDAYDAFNANGGDDWPTDETTFCKASLSGVPGCSSHKLGEGDCETISIGNLDDEECGVSISGSGCEIDCGECYIFRAFSHAVPGGHPELGPPFNLSPFTGPPRPRCSTGPCGGEGNNCSQGFWKNHPNAWPTWSCDQGTPSGPSTDCGTGYMCFGSACYIKGTAATTGGGPPVPGTGLLGNLGTPAGGDGDLILAHQLIAAELNIASGNGGTCYNAAIAAALATGHAQIACYGGISVGSGSYKAACTSAAMIATADILDEFNAQSPCHNCDE